MRLVFRWIHHGSIFFLIVCCCFFAPQCLHVLYERFSNNALLKLVTEYNVFRRSMTNDSAVRGQIGPNFEHFRDFMVFLHEEDPIKNEGALVLKRLYINILGTEGHLTP